MPRCYPRPPERAILAGRPPPERRSHARRWPPSTRAHPPADRRADAPATRRRSRQAGVRRTSTASCPGSSSTPASCTRPATRATRCSSARSSWRSSPATSMSSSRSAIAGLRQQVEAGAVARAPDGRTPAEQLAAVPRARPAARRRALGDLPGAARGARRRGRRDRRLRRDPGAPRRAPPAVPRRDLPGPHAARRRPGAPVPVHLHAEPLDRRRLARPGHRRARVRAGQGAADPAATARGRAAPLHPDRPGHRGEPRRPVHRAWRSPSAHLFRVTRNADFTVEEDEADDLLMAIEEELRRRRFGAAVRLEVERTMPAGTRNLLLRGLGLERRRLLRDHRHARPDRAVRASPTSTCPTCSAAPWTPVMPPRLMPPDEDEPADVFAAVRAGDILVHHPYESFAASVERFITQAADDPDVLTIKMTLYRTSGDSPIVQSLIRAAERGKQVVVLVEIKARFDEEANIIWARKLERAGAHVVYGLVGLKTHSKTALVVRREGSGLRRYVHIGTGNYNPKTARLYVDLGLLTVRPEIGADVTDLFNVLTGLSRQRTFRRLLVAPHSLRSRVPAPGRARDRPCRGRAPGPDRAEAQRDRRYARHRGALSSLERRRRHRPHRAWRVLAAARGARASPSGSGSARSSASSSSTRGSGASRTAATREWYIGSADLMDRNLDRRVEAIVPVEDAEAKAPHRGDHRPDARRRPPVVAAPARHAAGSGPRSLEDRPGHDRHVRDPQGARARVRDVVASRAARSRRRIAGSAGATESTTRRATRRVELKYRVTIPPPAERSCRPTSSAGSRRPAAGPGRSSSRTATSTPAMARWPERGSPSGCGSRARDTIVSVKSLVATHPTAALSSVRSWRGPRIGSLPPRTGRRPTPGRSSSSTPATPRWSSA